MNGLGYGTDSDSDSSVTRAGITGIAGSQDITTDNRAEYAGILENSFDAGRVNEELGAQTQITQEFGEEAPKAVGDYLGARLSGASDKTAENIAIGVALGTNTASSGAGARAAVTGKVTLSKSNQYTVTKPTGKGKLKFEVGAKANNDEEKALNTMSSNGLNVTFQKTASEKGISNERTADTHIEGFGQVDIITTASTKVTSIARRVEKKDTQAPSVYINVALDSATQKQVANSVFGKPTIKNINTILFENTDGSISIFRRNK